MCPVRSARGHDLEFDDYYDFEFDNERRRERHAFKISQPSLNGSASSKSTSLGEKAALKGILVTTSAFTGQARELAQNLAIELVDGEQLARLLTEYKQ